MSNDDSQITDHDYDPDYMSDMNALGDDPGYIRTPPVHTGYTHKSAPTDTRYEDLASRANSGSLNCQYAIMPLYRLRPYSDYKPHVDDEFQEEFISRRDSPKAMTITVYEDKPGQFIVASTKNDYAVYEMHKRTAMGPAFCIILGDFTKACAIEAIDKPFTLKLTDYDPQKTARHIAHRLEVIQKEKMIPYEALARRADLRLVEYLKIVDRLHPQAPSLATLERIAKVLGVTSADILPF